MLIIDTPRTGRTHRLLQRALTEIERGNKVCLIFDTKEICDQVGYQLRGKVRPSDLLLGTPTELGLDFKTMTVGKYPDENLVVLVDHHVIEQYFNEGFNQLAGQESSINLSFEQALLALKKGKIVCRENCNSRGMWIEMVEGTKILNTYLRIKNAQGTFDTWVPSISDLLANDWLILE